MAITHSELDSATSDQKSKPTYPLETNDLVSLVAYEPSAAQPSALRSLVSLPRSSLFTRVTTATPAQVKLYSTVQVSVAPESHIELNSGLLYMNHSCNPSLEIHVRHHPSAASEATSSGSGHGSGDSTPVNEYTLDVYVAADRDLHVGDELTFFYPSTEWQMARPFECLSEVCRDTGRCLGEVSGARDVGLQKLQAGGWWVNDFIREALQE